MDTLADLDIFLTGVGILLLGSGLMWFVSEYSKNEIALVKKFNTLSCYRNFLIHPIDNTLTRPHYTYYATSPV